LTSRVVRLRYDWLLSAFIFTICLTVWVPFALTIGGLNFRASQIFLPLVSTALLLVPPRTQVSVWSLLSVVGALVWWAALALWTLLNGPQSGHPLARVVLMGLNLAQALVVYLMVVRLGSVRAPAMALLVSVGILNVMLLCVSAAPSFGIPISPLWLDSEMAPLYVDGQLVSGAVQRFVGGGVLVGCVSASCVVLALCLWFDASRRGRLLLAASAVAGLVGMVVGFSRQSVLSLVIGLAVIAPFLLGRGRMLRLLRLAGLTAALMTIALGIVFSTPQGRQFWSAFAGRAVQFTDPDAYRSGTAEGRMAIWLPMFQDFARNPFVGRGQDAYLVYMGPGEEGAHNFPVEVLHSTGLVGMLGYLLLHGIAPLVVLRALLRRGLSEEMKLPLAGTLGAYAAMTSASVTNLIYWNPTYWLALALMIAAARLAPGAPVRLVPGTPAGHSWGDAPARPDAARR
jgi:O-antigen ligase